MTLIAVNLTLIEFIALPLVATIFGAAVYFFLKSRQSLRETMNSDKLKSFPNKLESTRRAPERRSLAELEEQFSRKKYEAPVVEKQQQVPQKKHIEKHGDLADQLKSTIAQQQKMLNTYLEKVEEMENEKKDELKHANEDLQKEIHKLHLIIEKKDEELDAIQQQAETAQRMAAKIEEVYEEFDLLQSKMAALEKQANRANNLAMELEDAKQSYEQVHQDIARKQEKLEDALNENQRMHREIELLEDKLAEANLQRQQLQKKVQLLQELNSDMQSISETNKKLQTEIRRIGELESMLTLMAEERDYLLRRKSEK